jgi:hypothetical protein
MSQQQKDDQHGFHIGEFYQPPHVHEWRYNTGGRWALRTCDCCGRSYVLLALGEGPSLGMTWVRIAEDTRYG